MTPVESFPFDAHFQQALLRLVVDDDAFTHLGVQHFKASFFDNVGHRWIFDRAKEHWERYGRAPSVMAIYEYLRQLDPGIAATYMPIVSSLEHVGKIDAQFVGDRIVEWVRRNLFVEGFEQARKLYNAGDIDKAFDFWQQRAESLRSISLGEIDRGWFFESFEQRQQHRRNFAAASHLHTFPTGIAALDKILNGGLSLGELGTWIAYAKQGKSMCLSWLAFFAVRALRVPTLITVHEGGRKMIEDRIESSFAMTVTNLVARGELTAQAHRLLHEEYRDLRGLLVIRGYTKDDGAWNANVGDIAAELKELRRFNFRPRLIVVDYADLLRSREKGALKETEHQTAAAKDLKTLTARDDGYAIWTASQAQRKNPKADRDPNFFVRSEHIADAIGKIRIADFYGSINRTAEEKANNRARLFAEDYRSGSAGQVIHVETDYAHGRFLKSVVHVAQAPEVERDDGEWG